MSKTELVNVLIKKGYKAEIVDGVVMIYDSLLNMTSIDKIIKETRYDCSWGIKNTVLIQEEKVYNLLEGGQ